MRTATRNVALLIAGIVLLYVVIVILLLRVLPPQPTAADLMVAGSVATFVALFAVFGFLYFTQVRRPKK